MSQCKSQLTWFVTWLCIKTPHLTPDTSFDCTDSHHACPTLAMGEESFKNCMRCALTVQSMMSTLHSKRLWFVQASDLLKTQDALTLSHHHVLPHKSCSTKHITYCTHIMLRSPEEQGTKLFHFYKWEVIGSLYRGRRKPRLLGGALMI